MDEKLILEELKKARRSQNRNCIGIFISAILILIVAIKGDKISQNANPSVETTVGVSPSLVLTERASRRGHFTKEEFADLMGFSVRTLDRRIAEGRLIPAPRKNEGGKVMIDLETTIAE